MGLGTAGAAAAALCARKGLKVVGLERGPLDQAGARWVNGVPAWGFREAGFAIPQAMGNDHVFHLIAGWGPDRISVRSILDIDMRALVHKLQTDAVDAGAELKDGIKVLGLEGNTLQTDGEPVTADVFVDASGLTGPNLLGTPKVTGADICTAAQEVRKVADPAAAEAFFERHGAKPGEVTCFTGIAGGYSILNVRLQQGEVSLLTGTIPALGNPGGRQLLDTFLADNPWVGDRIFGGARAIPIREPWTVIGRGNVAAIGDTACQVHAAHGSGILQQMLAAKVLAEALADGEGPAGYNVRWQRQHGALLAGAALFRRFSQDLTTPQLSAMIRRGVLSPPMTADTMQQRPPRPPLRALAKAGAGMATLPRVLRGLGPILLKMRLLERHYAQYPDAGQDTAAWERRLRRLM